MKFLFSLFTLILLAESCNSSKKANEHNLVENKNIVQNTLSGSYTITQIGHNKAISSEVIIEFDEATNKVNGFAGCNRFFGTYSLQNNVLKFSNIASSKKYCQKKIMDIENTFIIFFVLYKNEDNSFL